VLLLKSLDGWEGNKVEDKAYICCFTKFKIPVCNKEGDNYGDATNINGKKWDGS
jgi:hypothetical protein